MARKLPIGLVVVSLLLTAFGAVAGCLVILLKVITHPLSFFKKTPRNVPPECLQDSSLGTHEYVRANGLKFHCVCSGDKSKPLMLFLHGFPEFWFSWRHQLREFSKDYRVVAIDLRGYGETDRPPNKMDYTMSKLTQDIVELIPALGYSQCTLVSHDWGGAIAWRVVTKHPELVERFIACNSTHEKVFQKQLSKGYKQLLRSWYMFMFQVPKVPEMLLSICDYNLFSDMFAGVKNKDNFSPDVTDALKYTFSKPGALTAAINYYRCMFVRNDSESNGERHTRGKIDVPCLMLWGDKDIAFKLDTPELHQMVCSDLTVKHFPECSHWPHQEEPGEVNQAMRDFLARE